MPHRVSTESRGGRTIHRLHDDATGAEASVLPSYGFNLFDLRLPLAGKVRPVIHADPNWAEDPQKPGRNGIPVLFPYPNRVREGRYTFGGKTYQLPINKAPNSIHGFAIEAAWDVVEHRADDSGASVTGRYRIATQSPEMLASWPTDAVLEMRYTLSGRRLALAATISNPTAKPLPIGFGIHSYFRLPFDPDGDQERTEIILPASETWVLEESLPTGERRGVEDRLDFRRGRPIANLKVDDVLTALEFEGDRSTSRLVDRNLDAELRLGIGPGFRELVVFTPPSPGGVIAIEPYTQTTDAINLQARGIDAGLRVLEHGDQSTFHVEIEVRE